MEEKLHILNDDVLETLEWIYSYHMPNSSKQKEMIGHYEELLRLFAKKEDAVDEENLREAWEGHEDKELTDCIQNLEKSYVDYLNEVKETCPDLFQHDYLMEERGEAPCTVRFDIKMYGDDVPPAEVCERALAEAVQVSGLHWEQFGRSGGHLRLTGSDTVEFPVTDDGDAYVQELLRISLPELKRFQEGVAIMAEAVENRHTLHDGQRTLKM